MVLIPKEWQASLQSPTSREVADAVAKFRDKVLGSEGESRSIARE